jgi:hypothetical protein
MVKSVGLGSDGLVGAASEIQLGKAHELDFVTQVSPAMTEMICFTAWGHSR